MDFAFPAQRAVTSCSRSVSGEGILVSIGQVMFLGSYGLSCAQWEFEIRITDCDHAANSKQKLIDFGRVGSNPPRIGFARQDTQI